jgi:hypothetical protein
MIITYGIIPRVATADGRDKIPSEIFSATITKLTMLANDFKADGLC